MTPMTVLTTLVWICAGCIVVSCSAILVMRAQDRRREKAFRAQHDRLTAELVDLLTQPMPTPSFSQKAAKGFQRRPPTTWTQQGPKEPS